jgi:hypothetical protein
MVAYELYLREKTTEVHLIGILPERRKNPERITQESIMKWAGIVLGDLADVNLNNFFFIRVTIDEITGQIFKPTPSIRAQEEE